MTGAETNKYSLIRLTHRLLLAGAITMTGVLMLALPTFTYASESLHAPFSALLKQYVVPVHTGNGVDSSSTQVDYAGLKASRSKLTAYLNALSDVTPATFNQWDKNTQLAFLINAYNAYTIELILTRYPDLESIRDIGGFFSSPWKQKFVPLLGETRSLDDIEHGLIRAKGVYHEPRIHFAVNCASIGCPALREEAYSGDKLDAQLEAQTRRFLADKTRNYYRDGTFYVSKIFSWYQDDFEMGWQGVTSLPMFLLRYKNALGLSETDTQSIASGKNDIVFLDYNWELNDLR